MTAKIFPSQMCKFSSSQNRASSKKMLGKTSRRKGVETLISQMQTTTGKGSSKKGDGKKARVKGVRIRIPVPVGNKDWDYLLPKAFWQLGKVQGNSDGRIFTTLGSRFNEFQIELFRQSCFGHLLDGKYICLNKQLIHQVLIREVKQGNKDEMWFNFNGKLARFSIEEFCLITGLHCIGEANRKKFCHAYNRLRYEYFADFSNVNIPALLEIFNGDSVTDDSDIVSLGILCMLTLHMYTVKYPKAIEDTLMVLVDSQERDTYAWGRELFKYTLRHLKGGLRNKTMSKVGNRRPSIGYRINGYLIAFQVWIYETLPALQGLVCTKVNDRLPRLLNWTSDVVGLNRKVNVAKEIFAREQLLVTKLEATDIEMVQPYAIKMFEKCDPRQMCAPDSEDPFPTHIQETLTKLCNHVSVPSTSKCIPDSGVEQTESIQGDENAEIVMLEDEHADVTTIIREWQRHAQSQEGDCSMDSPIFGVQTNSTNQRQRVAPKVPTALNMTRTDHIIITDTVRKLDFNDVEVNKSPIRGVQADFVEKPAPIMKILRGRIDEIITWYEALDKQFHKTRGDVQKNLYEFKVEFSNMKDQILMLLFENNRRRYPLVPPLEKSNSTSSKNPKINEVNPEKNASDKINMLDPENIPLPNFDLFLSTDSEDIPNRKHVYLSTVNNSPLLPGHIQSVSTCRLNKRKLNAEHVSQTRTCTPNLSSEAIISLSSDDDGQQSIKSGPKVNKLGLPRKATSRTVSVSPVPFGGFKTPDLPTKRVQMLAPCMRSPFVQTFSSGCVTPNTKERYIFKYLDCLAISDPKDVDEYEKWFAIGYRPNNRGIKFLESMASFTPPMMLGDIRIDEKMWWYDLQNRDSLLSSSHIDAMFYYFRIFTSQNFGKPNKATSTDLFFHNRVKAIYKRFQRNPQLIDKGKQLEMCMYPAGTYITFSLSWAAIDYVYMPIFLDNQRHWILVVLDIKGWKLDVYNSCRRKYSDAFLIQSLAHIRIVIPMLIRNSGVLSREIAVTAMPCHVVQSAPQQRNETDCGIFIIKYAEYLFMNKYASMSSPFDTLSARKNMAIQLFRFWKEKPEAMLA